MDVKHLGNGVTNMSNVGTRSSARHKGLARVREGLCGILSMELKGVIDVAFWRAEFPCDVLVSENFQFECVV